jgi:NAD(P)H-hydrate epimerase
MIRLKRAQVREVDRLCVERYHIPSIVLMENAARSVIDSCADLFPRNAEIAVLCGGGNNGGDGLAIARHLHNRGYLVSVVLAVAPESFKGDALTQWQIAQAMKLNTFHFDVTRDLTGVFILREASLIVDALLGTGLTESPRANVIPYIDACNEGRPFESPVIAVDLPSGLDCDTGEPLGPCVRATRTVTFVAQKAGFVNPKSKQFTGDVVVGDIGAPRELIEVIAADAHLSS